MQKIFSVEQIRNADAYTIAHEPVASVDLMERAANRVYEWIVNKLDGQKPAVYIFCGPGNNGGDGLVLSRLFAEAGFSVFVSIPEGLNYSEDFSINLSRLKGTGIEPVFLQQSLNWKPGKEDIVIDALFGSGLSKPVSGLFAEVITNMNRLDCIKLSVDIPSGLFADAPVEKGNPVVKADYTLSFQFPKLAFLFAENDPFVGEWVVLPIGLHPDFISSESSPNYFVTREEVQTILRKRSKFSHKGTYGHALLISGSMGKMGAAVLGSRACLRAGTGLLTTHIPGCGYEILQSAVPEAMASVDPCHNECSRIPDLAPYTAIGIGPGLGQSKEAANTVRLAVQDAKVPLVLDADALNILSEQKTWQAFLPAGSILTPHPKEFERLAGKSGNSFEQLQLLRDYCIRFKVYIVLKGAHTVICSPGGNCYFNSTGNPGMATGGSGDVLTGIILGLLAQRYPPLEACLLGVYLHGLAGDIAADYHSREAMIASDIIENMGQAFQEIS